MGEVHSFMGKDDSAFDCYTKAKPLFQEVGSRLDLATVELSLGDYYKSRGEHDEALECVKRGLMIFHM